ncbi:MAG TPA: aspartate aminotransferase family protein, partial [Clostridia bacterium]|nr:aspartate aminotransferase family protein [Clostridia bacterium]
LRMPGVTVVSGLGMMLGISLEGVAARDLVQAVMAQGVLVLTAKDRLRLLPPLSISWDELNEALDIVEKTMKAVQAQ